MASNRNLLVLPGDGIGPEVMNEVRKISHGEFVTTLVLRVAGMAAQPSPIDRGPAHRGLQALPEVNVFHRLAA
jgi:hypothetical protein